MKFYQCKDATFVFSLVILLTLGSSQEVRFELDTLADKGIEWSFDNEWFLYGQNVTKLKQVVSRRNYTVPGKFWDSFHSEAKGIWALFSHMRETPRPSTSFSFMSPSTPFDHLNITYLMYGEAYINITSEVDHLIAKPIHSDCFNIDCAKQFKTSTAYFANCNDTDCDSSKIVDLRYYSFTVSLNATAKDSFILIDKIVPIPIKEPTTTRKPFKNTATRVLKSSAVVSIVSRNDPNDLIRKTLNFGWFEVGFITVICSTLLIFTLYKVVHLVRDKIRKNIRHVLITQSEDSDCEEGKTNFIPINDDCQID